MKTGGEEAKHFSCKKYLHCGICVNHLILCLAHSKYLVNAGFCYLHLVDCSVAIYQLSILPPNIRKVFFLIKKQRYTNLQS